jgi:homoserine O-acetyltransferase
MEKTDHTFHYPHPFELESGATLPGFQLRYTVLGRLNEDRSNVIWICHALTGNSDFTDWWRQLVQPGGPFDPEHYLIICANVLGGCYGSTGPLSLNPKTGEPYFHDFPELTNRDVVRAFSLLRQELRFKKIHTLLGGSLGGQHVLSWAILEPDLFERISPIACNAFHSPWGIAFNEAQRMAIAADSSWPERDARAGYQGLQAARAIGILSYRNYEAFGKTQAEKTHPVTRDFRAASYQRYQGEKLSKRFNAITYWRLTRMMDSHQVGFGYESVEAGLQQIKAQTLVIGVASDLLFPVTEQEFLVRNIEHAALQIIHSLYGHDGFLIEFDQLQGIIKKFLNTSVVGAVA